MTGPMRSLVVGLSWVGLVGCSPTLAIDVTLEDPTCVSPDAVFSLLIEDGPCGARASVRSAHDLATLAIDGSPIDALDPGAYCIDAAAYHRDDRARLCRLEALDRENRRLPADRGPLSLEAACEPPSELGDQLLFAAAGCNGRCDEARCICTGSCDLGSESARCAPAAEVEELVMGDHYVCGIGPGHRDFVCWGDDAISAAVDGAEMLPGVAASVLPLAAGEGDYVLFDGSPDALCTRTSEGLARCGHVTNVDSVGLVLLRVIAAGSGFVCGGEADVRCVRTEGTGDSPSPLLGDSLTFPTRLSAGREALCGIVGGVIHCATPLAPLPACNEASCAWNYEACDLACTTRELRPEPSAILPASSPQWIELDLGWDRACAIDTRRRLSCWSFLADDRTGIAPPVVERPRLGRSYAVPELVVDDLGALIHAVEVSVGSEHICVRRAETGVACGRLERRGESVVLTPMEPFPGQGAIGSFAAGPQGITCAVRAVENAPSRVECFQLEGFTEGHHLLGRTNTRDLDPLALDADQGDLAVCP